MSYTLTAFPEWDLEEGRARLTEVILGRLGADRGRLRSFDIAPYIPTNLMDAQGLVHMGIEGPAIQIVGHLAHEGDEAKSRAFRTTLPRNIAWADLNRLGGQIADSMFHAIRAMRIVERTIAMPAVITDAPVADMQGNPVAVPIQMAANHEPANEAAA